MTIVITVLAALALSAMGAGYYRFCRSMSGSLLDVMADGENHGEKGGEDRLGASAQITEIATGHRF